MDIEDDFEESGGVGGGGGDDDLSLPRGTQGGGGEDENVGKLTILPATSNRQQDYKRYAAREHPVRQGDEGVADKLLCW